MFLSVALQREALWRRKVARFMQLITAEHPRLSKGEDISAQAGDVDDDAIHSQ